MHAAWDDVVVAVVSRGVQIADVMKALAELCGQQTASWVAGYLKMLPEAAVSAAEIGKLVQAVVESVGAGRRGRLQDAMEDFSGACRRSKRVFQGLQTFFERLVSEAIANGTLTSP